MPIHYLLCRLNRCCLIALTTTMLCACNDYEPARDNSAQVPPIAASLDALRDAGMDLSNAKPVNEAPAAQGFSLQASVNTIIGAQTPVHTADSRLALTLTGNVVHQSESAPSNTLWVQREGAPAVLLNANSPEAIALLPNVENASRLAFGFIAANTQGYVGEQLTAVQVLPNDAPYWVNTRLQDQQAPQITLSVALKGPATEAITLHYATQDGSAIANRDYVPVSGELVFEPGQRSLLVPVPLLSKLERDNTDVYFKLVVTGAHQQFNGTVHGYGAIIRSTPANTTSPNIAQPSAVNQNELPGSAGAQRVHLMRPSTDLKLSVSSICTLANAQVDTGYCPADEALGESRLLEDGAQWQNASWPIAPTVSQRYVLSNTADVPLDYTVYVFDGAQSYEISGQIAAHRQTLVYTAFAEATNTGSSSSNGASSSVAPPSSSSSSSEPAVIAHTLSVDVVPMGLDATALTLTSQFNDGIEITTLQAQLNGAPIANQRPVTITHAQLNSGFNALKLTGTDSNGTHIERDIHVYFADQAQNTFIGDGPINIFVGQQGVDSFTGGDGTNIYLPGTGNTQFFNGNGHDIFIHQIGASPMRLEGLGSTEDIITLPSATVASARVRQSGEQSFYLEADAQSMNIQQYFDLDGSVQSSIQRIIFADGELTAADIRRLVHTALPGNDTYWGFNGDDTLIDTSGDDVAFGGAGDDTIHVNGYAEGGEGNDIIHANHGVGGAGNDEIHAISNAAGGDGNDTLYTNDYASGDAGDDTLHGDNNDNSLFGGLGDDTIFGYGGDDSLFGDEGNSTLYGGDGDDYLFAAEGEFNDTLIGGNGNDNLWGYDGDNYFDGGAGDETFFAGNGTNTILCGEGNHSIFSTGAGNDTITCGSGIDSIFMEDGNDVVDSGAGDDQLYADEGNKNITAGAGDDELHLNGGLTCTVEGGSGNDALYASCNSLIIHGNEGADQLIVSGLEQLEVTGGFGEDSIILSGRPYADAQLPSPPYTHIFWSPGEGNDTYTITGYATQPDDNTATPSATADPTLVDALPDNKVATTHFYLGGSAALDSIRFEQAGATSLLMQYNDATTGLDETLTFNHWFNPQTGLATSEKFYRFILPDLSTIKTASINAHFNQLYYRNFDGEQPLGLTAVGMPVISDNVVIAGNSVLVATNNYLVRETLKLTAPDWTIEFWVSLPTLLQTTTPIMQWGESPYGEDGFGLTLINTGEGLQWELMCGETHRIINNTFDNSGASQHVAVVHSNNQLMLYINGQPSGASLSINDTSMPRALSLGHVNLAGNEIINSSPWYLDELLINYRTAKYLAPFSPHAVPFSVEYVPSRASDAQL